MKRLCGYFLRTLLVAVMCVPLIVAFVFSGVFYVFSTGPKRLVETD